jgi:Arc/MetJ-type ribon-helix-helix transcriptional regulator
MSQRLDITFAPKIVEDMDQLIKDGLYTSRSEFLRDAARERIFEIRREEAIKNLKVQKGMLTGKTKLRINKDKVIEGYAKKHGLKL